MGREPGSKRHRGRGMLKTLCPSVWQEGATLTVTPQ